MTDAELLFEIREFLQDIVGGAKISEWSVEHAREFVSELDKRNDWDDTGRVT